MGKIIRASFDSKKPCLQETDAECISLEPFLNRKKETVLRNEGYAKFLHDVEVTALELEIKEKCKKTQGRYLSKDVKEHFDLCIKDYEALLKDHAQLKQKNYTQQIKIRMMSSFCLICLFIAAVAGISFFI